MKIIFASTALVLEVTFGCVAFAALFSSGFGVYEKLFLGTALLLLSLQNTISTLQSEFMSEYSHNVLLITAQAIEGQINGESQEKSSELLTAYEKRRKIDDTAGGKGIAYVQVLLSTYIIWIVAGWAISRFVFPHIWPNGFVNS